MHNKFGEELADKISSFVGSWKFIILQSIILFFWVILNIVSVFSFDPYPFILMNLFLSFQAAYATPMILMSSNRQSNKDREKSDLDLEIDKENLLLLLEITKDIQKLKTMDHLDKDEQKILEDIEYSISKIDDKSQEEIYNLLKLLNDSFVNDHSLGLAIRNLIK
jgi:uncharacterized membrane protein